ncbi:MAG: Calx-beta domain-containing protein [Acidobacteriota bacterium]
MIKRSRVLSVLVSIILCVSLVLPGFVMPGTAQAATAYTALTVPVINIATNSTNVELGRVLVEISAGSLTPGATLTISVPNQVTLGPVYDSVLNSFLDNTISNLYPTTSQPTNPNLGMYLYTPTMYEGVANAIYDSTLPGNNGAFNASLLVAKKSSAQTLEICWNQNFRGSYALDKKGYLYIYFFASQLQAGINGDISASFTASANSGFTSGLLVIGKVGGGSASGGGGGGAPALPGCFGFDKDQYQVTENAGEVTVNVQRTGGSQGVVGVAYNVASNSAWEGSDYAVTRGTLSFGNGEMTKQIKIPIIDDAVYEGTEYASVFLFDPTGGATISTNDHTDVYILDNDEPSWLGSGSPNIVLDNKNSRYVSVYQKKFKGVTNDFYRVFGQFIGLNGTPIGQEFAISDTDSTAPVIVYDDIRGCSLVVWTEFAGTGSNSLKARIINSDGTLNETKVLASIEYQRTGNNYLQPSAVWDPINQRYLVVWLDVGHEPGLYTTDLYGQLINYNGNKIGSNFVVCSAANAQSEPSLTFDSTSQHYFLVWQDGRLGQNDIYGRLINSDGSLLGNDIVICSDSGNQLYPWVACDSNTGAFLVAWQDFNNNDICGQVLDKAGTLVKSELLISGAPGQQYTPTVACDPITHKFMVCWIDDRNSSNTGNDIYGQIINANASLSGSNFEVLKDSSDQIYPCLISGAGGLFMIAYENVKNPNVIGYKLVELATSGGQINIASSSYTVKENSASIIVSICRSGGCLNGVKVDYNTVDDSAKAGTDYTSRTGTLTFGNGDTEKTVEIPIIDNSSYQGNRTFKLVISNPSGGGVLSAPQQAVITIKDNELSPSSQHGGPKMAYDDLNDQYMSVFEGDFGIVGGQILNSSGQAVSPEFLISENSYAPSVVYDSVYHRYLVVWHDFRGGNGSQIYGQFYDLSGSATGSEFLITPHLTYQYQEYPAVAFDNINNQFLVVFGNRNVGSSISGQLVGADGRSKGSSFIIGNSNPDSNTPCVKFDSNHQRYLVAWVDDRSSKAYAQLVEANGTLIGNNIGTGVTAGYEYTTSIGYDSKNFRFLWVWSEIEYGKTNGSDLLGLIVDSNGNIEKQININIPDDQACSSIAFDYSRNKYLLTCMNDRSSKPEIITQYIYANGSLCDEFFFITNLAYANWPTATFNSKSNTFLVGYQSQKVYPPIVSYSSVIDSAARVHLTSYSYNADSDGKNATILVSRYGDLNSTVSVVYATSNYTAYTVSDYTMVNGTITFNPGETLKSFKIPIIRNSNSQFKLLLSNPTGCLMGHCNYALITCNPTTSGTPVSVTSVALTPKTLSLAAGGEPGALSATVLPTNATNKNVTWSSSDTSKATVVNGIIGPVATGTALVTVTTADGGFTDTCTVTVLPQPTYGVTVGEKTKTVLYSGRTAQTIGDFTLTESWPGSLLSDRMVSLTLPAGARWHMTSVQSNYGNISTNVKNDGVGSVAFATAALADYSTDGRILRYIVANSGSSQNSPAIVRFTGLQIDVAPNFTGDISVSVAGTAGAAGVVKVATVNPLFTISSPGTATLQTNAADQAASDIIISEVYKASLERTTDSVFDRNAGVITSVYCDTLTLKVPLGVVWKNLPTFTVEEADLALDQSSAVINDRECSINVRSTSSKSSRIRVSNIVLSIANTVPPGDLNIDVFGSATARTYLSFPSVTKLCSCKVGTAVSSIPVPVTGISLPEKQTVLLGRTLTLNSTVNPSTATNKGITWSSADSKIASVLNGTVTGNKLGKTTITATTVDGHFSDNCEVTVDPVLVRSISITSSVSLGTASNNSCGLSITFDPPDATNKNVYWSSDNTSVAIVSNIGAVTALKAGSASITAKTEDGGFEAHCNVIVTDNSTGTSSGGGGGGGGGGGVVDTPPVTSTNGEASISKGGGGTIGLSGGEATVEIPRYAFDSSQLLKIKIEKDIDSSGSPGQAALASQVFDFSVDGYQRYTFLKNVTITLHYDTSLYDANDKLAIYYFDINTNTWVRVGGTISGSSISAEVNHFTKFAVFGPKKAKQPVTVNPEPNVEAPKKVFSDMSGNIALPQVNSLTAKAVIGGYSDGTFKPNKGMTRIEFIVALVKASGIKVDSKAAIALKDQQTIPAWARPYIAAAIKAGILPTVWGNKLNGNTPVSRVEAAYMLAKALKIKVNAKSAVVFKDKIPVWAAPYVVSITQKGLLKGYSDKTFKPNKQITRAEACVILYNALPVK